ncbi:hypothetical protein [Clostridium paraputrificum]|uniref:hypothetical protein n=1 Tax=Clostridium paraputrificum TaxID=29363 RepID=UPI000DD0ECD4|nr:hypothetical protein [Clostridium paraputrificum]
MIKIFKKLKKDIKKFISSKFLLIKENCNDTIFLIGVTLILISAYRVNTTFGIFLTGLALIVLSIFLEKFKRSN